MVPDVPILLSAPFFLVPIFQFNFVLTKQVLFNILKGLGGKLCLSTVFRSLGPY